MKPKTQLQIRVTELSSKLRPITDKQMQWAIDNCLSNYFARTRKSIFCLECGHTWKDEAFLVSQLTGCTCPECGKELKYSENSFHNNSAYYSIITKKENFQVIRMFWVQKSYKKGITAFQMAAEVMQHWIDEKGNITTMSKSVQGLSRYFDQWIFQSDLEVRPNQFKNCPRYNIGAYKTYPDRNYIPELKRNGFTGRFYDYTQHKFISLLLSVPAAETLLKSRQMNMLKYLSMREKQVIDCWPSIRICIRNNYEIKDASMWIDYINLLKFFGRDTNNAHYVCPADLKAAHDRYVKKKKALDRAKKLEELKAEMEKAQVAYEKSKSKYFGIMFQEKEITVKVLEHVSEFFEEGHEHGHCVFASEYYKKPDSLVLSARVHDELQETIELSLKTMKVVQSRGKGNKSSRYHKQILNLVNTNLYQVQQAMQQSVSV